MQFILTGFTPDTGFRVFAFQGVHADRTRTDFTVRADMALIRRYGIPVQELPLLCRRLLERNEGSGPDRALTFSEEEMCQLAASRSEERKAAQLRKSMRAPRVG